METQRNAILFYLTITSFYLFAIYKDWEILLNDRHLEIGINSQKTFGWRLKYLTFINLVIYLR